MTVECYYDDDGLLHWPDAELDSENYYGIDWDDWLTAEGVNETKVTATWDVPTGLTNMDEETVGNVEYVKLNKKSELKTILFDLS